MTAALKLRTDKIELSVSLEGRDSLSLSLDVVNGEIVRASLTGRGCTDFLRALSTYRASLKGPLASLPVPGGDSHSSMLLREAVLRARGEWNFPYTDEELCHCRAISTSKVDAAVISGCRSVRSIARETSAGTSCGSCRPDTDAIIAYRCQGK